MLQPECFSLQCRVELPQKLQQSSPGRGITSEDADNDDDVNVNAVEDVVVVEDQQPLPVLGQLKHCFPSKKQ